MHFDKMHGCGNDFIVTHEVDESRLTDFLPHIPQWCRRRFGIGADGVILVLPGREQPLRMRIFNSDGSEAEMCGNGIRCLARYAADHGLHDSPRLSVETGAGVMTIQREGQLYRVDMGRPQLQAPDIPVALKEGMVIEHPLALEGQTVLLTAVSMGNPHAVLFADELTNQLVFETAEAIKGSPLFPRSVNVECVRVHSPHEITIRVNERGVGETLACGTGACAAAVASILTKRCDKNLTIHLPGGDLDIAWSGSADDSVFMTGPAESVFSGVINP